MAVSLSISTPAVAILEVRESVTAGIIKETISSKTESEDIETNIVKGNITTTISQT